MKAGSRCHENGLNRDKCLATMGESSFLNLFLLLIMKMAMFFLLYQNKLVISTFDDRLDKQNNVK
jgi:hypothetical protein